jgi:hypothetical protein
MRITLTLCALALVLTACNGGDNSAEHPTVTGPTIGAITCNQTKGNSDMSAGGITINGPVCDKSTHPVAAPEEGAP